MDNTEMQNMLARDCNVIEQLTVSKLLDGRYFFIPSYQRGYRWSKKQVYDLCNDLLEYVLKKDKSDGSFYSLQPLIVHKGNYRERYTCCPLNKKRLLFGGVFLF